MDRNGIKRRQLFNDIFSFINNNKDCFNLKIFNELEIRLINLWIANEQSYKLCKYWKQHGSCPHRAKCRFQHFTLVKIDQKCFFHQQHRCNRGKNCHYIHNHNDNPFNIHHHFNNYNEIPLIPPSIVTLNEQWIESTPNHTQHHSQHHTHTHSNGKCNHLNTNINVKLEDNSKVKTSLIKPKSPNNNVILPIGTERVFNNDNTGKNSNKKLNNLDTIKTNKNGEIIETKESNSNSNHSNNYNNQQYQNHSQHNHHTHIKWKPKLPNIITPVGIKPIIPTPINQILGGNETLSTTPKVIKEYKEDIYHEDASGIKHKDDSTIKTIEKKTLDIENILENKEVIEKKENFSKEISEESSNYFLSNTIKNNNNKTKENIAQLSPTVSTSNSHLSHSTNDNNNDLTTYSDALEVSSASTVSTVNSCNTDDTDRDSIDDIRVDNKVQDINELYQSFVPIYSKATNLMRKQLYHEAWKTLNIPLINNKFKGLNGHPIFSEAILIMSHICQAIDDHKKGLNWLDKINNLQQLPNHLQDRIMETYKQLSESEFKLK